MRQPNYQKSILARFQVKMFQVFYKLEASSSNPDVVQKFLSLKLDREFCSIIRIQNHENVLSKIILKIYCIKYLKKSGQYVTINCLSFRKDVF